LDALKGKRIFLIEDNVENRIIFQITLSGAGVIVGFDTWGRDILSKLRAFAPIDLILLDLMYPMGITGYAIYDKLRMAPEFADVPVVAVSAADSSEAIPRCREKGFAGFIAKPIDEFTFRDQIAEIMAGREVWYDGR
jgi:CheY-like chemotaxis protein